MRSEKLSVLAASAALLTGAGGCGVGEKLGLEEDSVVPLQPNSPECAKVYDFDSDKFGPEVQEAVRLTLRENDPEPEAITEVIKNNAGCFDAEPPGDNSVKSIFGFEYIPDYAWNVSVDFQKEILSLASNDPIATAKAIRLTDRVKDGEIDFNRASYALDEIAETESSGYGTRDNLATFKNRILGELFKKAKEQARFGHVNQAIAMMEAFPGATEDGPESIVSTDFSIWQDDYYDGLGDLALDALDETVTNRAKQLVGRGRDEKAKSLGRLIHNGGLIDERDFRHDINGWITMRDAINQVRAGRVETGYATIDELDDYPNYDQMYNRLSRVESQTRHK